MIASSGSNVSEDFVVEEFTYTTADIEKSRFSGERPDPIYFATPETAPEYEEVVLTVIDGELRVVRNAEPPIEQDL